MALEKNNLSWGLLTTHIFSRAIPDHFLTELSILLLRVACSGHKEAKNIVGIKMTENRVALVIAKFTI